MPSHGIKDCFKKLELQKTPMTECREGEDHQASLDQAIYLNKAQGR